MLHRTRWSTGVAVLLALWTATPGVAQCQESQKLIAQNGSPQDYFGIDVDMHCEVAIIGAPSSPEVQSRSGSAHVYTARGSVWKFSQELTASDGEAQDRFGISVAISEDVAVVGASSDDDLGRQSGSVYVFHREGSSWTEAQKLTASDGKPGDLFGYTVDIDDDVLIVGSWQQNAMYVFRHDGGEWVEEQKLTPPVDSRTVFLGYSVAIEGDVAVGGGVADDKSGKIWGTAHAYRFNGDAWVHEQQMLVPAIWTTGFFGVPVAISGDVIIVGAFLDSTNGTAAGSAAIYRHDGESWIHEDTLAAPEPQPSDLFGSHVAVFGDSALVGSTGDNELGPNAGAAYIFQHIDGKWSSGQRLVASDGEEQDSFGAAVAMAERGALIGAAAADTVGESAGAAYVFTCQPFTPCPADLTGDGSVTVSDLLIVLSNWGSLDGPGDLTGDGIVDLDDLLEVLAAWGDCP